MEVYFFILIPFLILVPFLIGNLMLKKAAMRLDSSSQIKYSEIRREMLKRFFPLFLILPIMLFVISLFTTDVNQEILSKLPSVVILYVIFYYYRINLLRYKSNNFSQDFIRIFKMTEFLKILFFGIILLIIYL